MRTFRGKEVLGWRIVEFESRARFETELNRLMDKYEFDDCQYSIKNNKYTALVLISEKECKKPCP